MSIIERFTKNSRIVGKELIRFEAEKSGLGQQVGFDDNASLISETDRLAAITGIIDPNETAQAFFRGTNSSRGLRNERVKGFRK
jgi:hypothetical protein